MAIDLALETLVSLSEAAKLLPRRRRGKRPHVSCLYRWTTVGCRGVILESVQVGATRCTSHEAIGRFFDRLTAAAQQRSGDLLRPRTPRQRQIASERAAGVLKERGV